MLCLSNGNAAGLGRTREKELELSCKKLGFSEAPTCIDDPELQDGMDKQWAPELVASYIEKFCKQKETNEGPEGKINMIVTFDEHGVSYHPNHQAVHRGAEYLMTKQLVEVELLTLCTVTLIRKYIGFIDILLIWITQWHAFRYNFYDAYQTLALHES